MSIDAINLALTLNDRDYRRSLDENRKGLTALGNTKMTGVQAGVKGATRDLANMEKQAKKTGKSMGLLQRMDKVGKRLQVAGLGLGALGGGMSLAGMAMNGDLSRMLGIGSKKPPPIPGTKAAKRAAFGTKLAGMGNKIGLAGTAAGAAGGVIGAVPGIAKLLGGSKGASGAVNELTSKLGGLSSAAGNAGRSSGGLGSKLSGLGGLGIGILGGAVAGVAALGAGLGAVAVSGMGFNSRMEEAKTQFEVFTGSALKADDIIQTLQARADITPFDTAAYVEGGTALMSAAKGSKTELMSLMKTAEMLTVLNPREGLTGAAVAMKNALSGDTTSLQDRFNIAPSTIKKYKDMGLTGQGLMHAILKEMNITEASVDKLGTTSKGMMSTIMSFVEQIRGALGSGLFGWMKERMAGAVEWISTNKTMVMDTATGIGTMIGDVLSRVWTYGTNVWNMFSTMGATLWQFFGGLPAKIGEAFQSGELMTSLMDMVGSLMNMTWNAGKFFFKAAWDGIVNGIPLLVSIVGKLVVDGLRDALGEKISGMLGLDKLSATLGDVAAGGAMVMKDNFKANFNDFMGEQKAAVADLGNTAKAVGDTLGWQDAQAAGAKSGVGGLGMLAQARAMGARQRTAKEKEIAGVQWPNGQAVPGADQAAGGGRSLDALGQAQEKYNAGVQGRSARIVNGQQGGNGAGAGNGSNVGRFDELAKALFESQGKGGARKQATKIQLITQQPMHPVATY